MDTTQADYAITRLYKDERLDGRLTVKRLQSFPKVLCRSIRNLQQDVYSFSAVSFYLKKNECTKVLKWIDVRFTFNAIKLETGSIHESKVFPDLRTHPNQIISPRGS